MAGANYAAHRALSANVVVQLALNEQAPRVRVVNVTGASAIYFRVDGVDPVVLGDDCYVVAAGAGAYMEVAIEDGALPAVKLVSAGTPTVAVMVQYAG